MGLTETLRHEDDLRTLAEAVPAGRNIRLRGRGTLLVRVAEGPTEHPPVVLIHGWLATGALNWFRCFEPLGENFTVVAPDMRGHGRGIRSGRRFRFADCADDVAALIEHLDLGPAILVGYSMGGPIAQLVWKNHPHLVAGMVFAATGAEFVVGNRQRYALSALGTALAGTTRLASLAALIPGLIARGLLRIEVNPTNPGAAGQWARREMSRHNMRMVFEAMQAIGNFSSRRWVGDIDVPTAVVVTGRDLAVTPRAQRRFASALSDATVFDCDDGHSACVSVEFGDLIAAACMSVADRVEVVDAV